MWKYDTSAGDLFYKNFGEARGRWAVCHRSWCASCYSVDLSFKFHITRPENDEGLKWERKVDMDRFLQARKGDMLCAQFQCDRCWFVNLKKREPIQISINDSILLGYTRRVNLDVFWSKETSTVYSNFLNVIKKKKRFEELKLVPIATARGHWPILDAQ